MSRNGSGIYVLPAGQPVITGTTISSTTHNTLMTDVANALTTSLAIDGQTVMSANLPMGGNKATGLGAATVAGDAARYEQIGALAIAQGAAAAGPLAGSGITGAAASGSNTDITSLSILSGYLFGCTLSTAGASATMSVSAGKAQDGTGAQLMTLAAIAKTTAAWVVGTGNGGLDTGAIANNTWYHFFVIRRPDTGVVDVLFSLSPTAPTLPVNYTQFRRIGSGLINGSAVWSPMLQNGDGFQWVTPVSDLSVTGQGSAAVSRTLSVPLGVSVLASLNVGLATTTTSDAAYLSDLATSDLPPSFTGSPGVTTTGYASGGFNSGNPASVRTNTSAQIRTRLLVGPAGVAFTITTLGWTDTRGRFAP